MENQNHPVRVDAIPVKSIIAIMSSAGAPFALRIAKFSRTLLLSVLNWLLFRNTPEAQQKRPRRILVMRFSALGDFILAIPALVELREAFPDSRISLLTAASSNESVRKTTAAYNASRSPCPWASFILPSQVDELIWIDSFNLKSLKEKILPRIQRFQPDITIILPQQDGGSAQTLAKKMVFLRLLGVRNTVVGWRSGNGPLFRSWNNSHALSEHAVMPPIHAVREATMRSSALPNNIQFRLNIEPTAHEWAKSIFGDVDTHSKVIIAVSPGSIRSHKQWPVSKFIELCTAIAETIDPIFVFVGRNEDHIIGQQLSQKLGSTSLNLCGKTSIQQLAAILQLADLTVGNDGGSMHLAAAVNCRCVAIISGIEYPGSIDPWKNERWSVRHKVDCAPCYCLTHCPKVHNRCIRDIDVSEVLRKCIEALTEIKTIEPLS